MVNKIVLIQIWIGEIPDYFWFHYETTKNIKGFDFLFFTDQDLDLESSNYRVIKIEKKTIEDLLSDSLNQKIQIKSNKKICDTKASLGDIFKNFISEYDYYGVYDIDTFFGDVYGMVKNYIGEYDVISIADEAYHNRISGPFILFRNTEEIRAFYKKHEYDKCFDTEYVECFEEGKFSQSVLNNFKVKLLYSTNVETNNGGKNTYTARWFGGKVFVNDEEKMIYHFYRKEKTKISKIGNFIIARYDKKFLDDFYWVVSFTENYEKLFSNLLESIKKYSNRKCIIYSINYEYKIPINDIDSEQFIVRRIDIPEGDKDIRGRDNNIISSKPIINIDVINAFPNKKFVSIDSDIYFTVNSDDISHYFNILENYPLVNSHIHEVIYLRNINPKEEWTSSLHLLLNEMGIQNCVLPRRKTNVLVFDDRSEWFFKEQMEVYYKYKNTIPGILALHDEDTANAILSKYNFNKCLHMVDIEEVYDIDLNVFYNYSYNMTPVSEYVVFPKNKNEVLFFHGVKSQEHYNEIKKNYNNSVMDCEELCVSYKNETIFFEKNSFFDTKLFKNDVVFKIYDEKMNELFWMGNQKIRNYFLFYISNITLLSGKYFIKIFEEETNNCIYKDIIEI